MRPDKYATSSVLSVVDIELGRQINSFAVKIGLGCDVYVASSLYTMYSKCESLDEAFQLFEGAVERDVVSWTSMIAGFTVHGQPEKTFEPVRKMHCHKKPLFAACSVCKSLRKGKEIHGFALHSAMERQTLVGSSLVNIYSKCGATVSTFRVFNRISEKDHSSVVSGLAQNGYCEEALMEFHEMLKNGLKMDMSLLGGVVNSHLLGTGQAISCSNHKKRPGVPPYCGQFFSYNVSPSPEGAFAKDVCVIKNEEKHLCEPQT
ncbi:hypothetical protein EJ110_NYTH50899 [Nymphaea thermarum]|nr:hypothetical protein EJ110_NYTH50899 [Nymphaea thermarum]